MTRQQAIDTIFDVLAGIAPEVERSEVAHSVDLTEQLDLDSMDYLNWLLGIHRATGVEIPDRDASKFLTIDGAADYLVARTVTDG